MEPRQPRRRRLGGVEGVAHPSWTRNEKILIDVGFNGKKGNMYWILGLSLYLPTVSALNRDSFDTHTHSHTAQGEEMR